MACRAELGRFPLIVAITHKKKIQNKENDSVVKQIFLMSVDLHSSTKNSFYSNLKRFSEFYNLPDFDPIFLTDA